MNKRYFTFCIVLSLFISGCKLSANTYNNSEITPTVVDKNSTAEISKGTNFTPIIVSNVSSLSNKVINWSWLYSPKDKAELLSKYNAYGKGDTSKKVIYLTFDEGYEYGYTAKILDTLKANNVHSAFFVTDFFVKGSFNGVKNTYLLKRMAEEGHLICNHSVHHKSMPKITDETVFDSEITGVENDVNAISGLKMSLFFRPPEGNFSERSLYYTQKLGYKTVFYNFAYVDYDIKKQPDPESSKALILKNTKNGMICLLHAVSKTNADILDSLIKSWKADGYEFKSLNNLP